MTDRSFSRILQQQEEFQRAVTRFSGTYSAALVDTSRSVTAFSNKFSKHLENYNATFEMLNKKMVYTSKLYSNFGKNFEHSFTKYLDQQQQLVKFYQKKSNHLKYFNYDSTLVTKYADSFSSILAEGNVSSIDVSGINELIIPDTSTATASVETGTTPKKTLADMTEEDLSRIVTGAITKEGKFSLISFIGGLFAEYVADAAKIIMEIVLVISITFSTGQYNDQVKIAIQDRIDESMVVKDTRKVITRYVKMEPTDQVAFLRTESFIRLGPSKSSPVAYFTKFSKNTVFTVVERRNNWIKVEIISGELEGDKGWVEESKLIKFKKMNY